LHATEGLTGVTGGVRRIGVFVDYWYAYTSARQVFAAPGAPPPPWFGNVSPRAVAAMVVKRPPSASRRSERVLGGLHVFVRHFDPEVHRGQLDRVRRWELEEAAVTVAPSREEGGGHWQSTVSVALACAVVEALAQRRYDTAVVFAGDGALWPMFTAMGGGAVPSQVVELATWVAPDGAVPTQLTALPHVWCHRLGEASFKQVVDDRRPSHHGVAAATPAVARPLRARAPGMPHTAMAAAMAAAGLAPAAAAGRRERDAVAAAASLPEGPTEEHPSPEAAAPLPEGDEQPRGVRRIANRLFGKST
jgi:hypothetical protein